MTERLLDVVDLQAGYGGSPVVRGVSLHVCAGEVVVLLGANGAGKSTTLLSISNLVTPVGGRIELFGENTANVSAHAIAAQGLAHVLENRSLFSHLSVLDNLRLGAGAMNADLDEVFELFPDLRAAQKRTAGLLSGGQQQMLAIARALSAGPRLLMIDEMSLGLAPLVASEILDVVRGIADQGKTGVLLVEQHVHLALQAADRGYLLSVGEIIADGPASELANDLERLEAGYLDGS